MLSTTSSAPRSWATCASAAMSAMLSSGLVGVSTQIDLRVVRADRRPHRVDVVDRRGRPVQPPALGDLGEQPVRAAVRVVRDDHVVAGCAQRPQQRVLGRQPAREGQRRAGRPRAPPGTPAARPGSGCRSGCTRSRAAGRADRVLRVGAGLVDRRHHRAGARVGLLAGVDGEGVEAVASAVEATGQVSLRTRGGLRVLRHRRRRRARLHRRPRRRAPSPSSTSGRCSRATCWSYPATHLVTLAGSAGRPTVAGYFGLVQRVAVAVEAGPRRRRDVRRDQQQGVTERRRTCTPTSYRGPRATACAASSGRAPSTPRTTRPPTYATKIGALLT